MAEGAVSGEDGEAIGENLSTEKRQSRSSAVLVLRETRFAVREGLLGGHLFLLAFHAHGLELALFGVVRFLDLGLDLGCRFFELG